MAAKKGTRPAGRAPARPSAAAVAALGAITAAGVALQPVGEGFDGRLTVLSSLQEAVLSPRKREVEVVALRPGLSKNGNFWGPDVVRAIVPLFEGAKAFADHPAPGERPERSIRDIVGYYKEPRVGPAGELRATLHVTEAAEWLWTLLKEAIQDGRPDVVAVSVDAEAQCRFAEMGGKRVRVVEAVKRLNSCDVVTRASAGGSFERLLQADNQSWWDDFSPLNEEAARMQGDAWRTGQMIGDMQMPLYTPDDVVPPVQLGPTVAAQIPGGQVIGGGYYVAKNQGTGVMTDQQGAPIPQAGQAGAGEAPESRDALLRGSVGSRQSAVGSTSRGPLRQSMAGASTVREGGVSLPTADCPLPTEGQMTMAEMQAELLATRRLLESERSLVRTLSRCPLPAPVKARLEKRFASRVFEQEELEGAIAEERDMLAELTDAGMIRGLGFEKQIRVGMSEVDRLQKAMDQLFDIYEGEKVPALSGIREAYVVATGDRDISGMSQSSRLLEADITTASFSFLLGTSMNKRLLKDYQAWPAEWQKFCTITPIKDFKQQDRIRLGAFGSLSTVPEDTAYTTVTLSDTRATYVPAKRGNLVPVTRETIVNDDLYAIKQIPGKLAVAAAFTLAEFVYGFLTATGNIYDGNPLFTKAGAHNNSQVTTPGTPNTGVALSSANMQAGVTAMRRQTNLAAKPIGLKPRFLVVPPELEWTAMVITKSAGAPGANFNDINPMLGYTEVLVVPQYSSITMWNLVADPRVIDTIEVGFVGGQVNPILFVQDQPLFGNNFTNDVITYKVRHEYGGAVVDYRGFYQGNN